MALVACETRFVRGPWPGTRVSSDGEPLDLVSPIDGARIRVPDRPFRNVRPIGGWHPSRGGWMTGTMQSPCLQLVYAAIAELPATDLDVIAHTVRDVVDRYRAAGTEDPNALLADGAIFLVCAGSFGLQALTIHGDGEIQPTGGYNIPPEFSLPDNGVAPVFQREVTDPLEATRQCEPGLAPRLRGVGHAFQRCADLCGPGGTVNDQVELGVLRIVHTPGRWRLRYDYLPPTPASELIASDPEGLLTPCDSPEVSCST